ncbi:hypothetical protein [Pseudorhodoferax sp.]|uniref:hypothetical protein n=1 Tax=Pseudorhodoferax sp. TaxID=1993553 RepID=UPI0039E231DF
MQRTDPERQIAEFIARYTPEMAASIRACRAKIRSFFPRGFELVYDNYNALVFAFGPSGRSSEAVLSLAAYPGWVTLFFAKGNALSDPDSLLQGKGKHIRGIAKMVPEQLSSAPVMRLIAEAMAPVEQAFREAPELTTIIQSVSEKQRPRQPARKHRLADNGSSQA